MNNEKIQETLGLHAGSYDAYLIPESIEEFSYTKDGKEIKGFQYKFKMEFPQKS